MARAARRSKKDIVIGEIEKCESKIAELTQRIETLVENKNNLLKELNEIEEAEAKAEEEAKTKELVDLIKEKRLSFEEVKELLENKINL